MSIYSIARNSRARKRRVEASERAGEAMNSSKGRSDPSPYLGVNKIGKIIQKPSFSSSSSSSLPPPPQNVYTISMHDFRSVVQQLTAGTPSAPQPPRPSSPPRLRKIRPPPLPLASPSPRLPPPPPPPPAPAESPVSAYMRYLLTSDSAAAPSPRLPFPSPLPSPSTFLNLLSPKSPCTLLPPLPPLSPGFSWPPSPSAFPPILSPTWKDLM